MAEGQSRTPGILYNPLSTVGAAVVTVVVVINVYIVKWISVAIKLVFLQKLYLLNTTQTEMHVLLYYVI